jgi:hypothetical protein
MRDTLRVFTDAAAHIPRHRRTRIFVHLISILGPHDFLAEVSMLLVDRVASKVKKARGLPADDVLALPLTVFENFEARYQLLVSRCLRVVTLVGWRLTWSYRPPDIYSRNCRRY